MKDKRNEPEKSIIKTIAKDDFERLKCPHCGRLLSKAYYNPTFCYCHYCGGKIKK